MQEQRMIAWPVFQEFLELKMDQHAPATTDILILESVFVGIVIRHARSALVYTQLTAQIAMMDFI